MSSVPGIVYFCRKIIVMNSETQHERMYLNCIRCNYFFCFSSVKTRPVRMPPGYQAELVIQLVWVDGEPPQQITSLAVSSAYGM